MGTRSSFVDCLKNRLYVMLAPERMAGGMHPMTISTRPVRGLPDSRRWASTGRRPDRSGTIVIPGTELCLGSPEWVLDWLQAQGQPLPRPWFRDETPQVRVRLASFVIDRHPVTVGQY